MSEAECRRWIAETIEWLRARKARPDQERICQALQRRHGVSPSRTRRQLERLLRARAVLRVSTKGAHSYRNAGPREPEPARPPPRERAPVRLQPGVVVTRARHKEQQEGRARSRRPAPAQGEAADRRRRLPGADTGPDSKKTRRAREAEASDSEESEEKVVPLKDRESIGQMLSGVKNEVEPVTDCRIEDGAAKERPTMSPASEDPPVEDVGEGLSTEEQFEVSSAVEQSPRLCPGDEPKDITEAELKREAMEHGGIQVRTCPDITGEARSSGEPVPVEEGCEDECTQKPGIHPEPELEAGDDHGLGACDAAGQPHGLEDRSPPAHDQATCHQPDPQTSEVPEVSGASCLLTPSASPVEMVPEENGPSDRHLLEEDGKSIDPTEWSIADVVNYFKEAGFPEQAIAFKDQEIDGKSLLLMKRNDVLTGLAIKLGPALKIYEYHIKVLQLHHFNNEAP
ncbi:sterile alpha motif domain-containing protein 1-like isoform X2 [Narcine bancroftii]|uniref:sterile alpha motif domain-containing protein 1-like isoform X2 n=1 Tax=Narcine bancroftii TaxID=1343680 RepID=UPI003831F9CA